MCKQANESSSAMRKRGRTPCFASSSAKFESMCTFNTGCVSVYTSPAPFSTDALHRGRTQIAAGSRTVLGIAGELIRIHPHTTSKP